MCVTSGKQGRLKNLLNNNYLKRWVGGVEHDSSRGGSSSSSEGYFSGKRHGYSIDEARSRHCRPLARTALACGPLMLSMLAIVAVCVCVTLLFKSSPEVYVLKPFS